MEVRPGHAARSSDLSEYLPRLQLVANSHVDLRKVSVQRINAQTMVHDDRVAGEKQLLCEDHASVLCRINGSASHCGEIHTTVGRTGLAVQDAALAEIKHAQELLPLSKDAFEGPDIANTAAEVHAILGDAAGAVAILDGLLQRPCAVTVPVLKVNPIWDPIRNDPGFKALIDKYGAKT